MSLSEQSPPAPPTTPPPAPRKTSGLAVAGLIFAFLIAPVGFVLSLIAIFKTGATKAKGRALAVIGLIVSTLAMAGVAAVAVFVASSSALDPGCVDGKQAIIDSGSNADPAALQSTIDALRAAAAKSDSADVRAAMTTLADDYAQLKTAVETGDLPPGIETKITADAERIDSLCTLGS